MLISLINPETCCCDCYWIIFFSLPTEMMGKIQRISSACLYNKTFVLLWNRPPQKEREKNSGNKIENKDREKEGNKERNKEIDYERRCEERNK